MNIKKWLSVFVFTLGLAAWTLTGAQASSQGEGSPWHTDYETAIALAKKEGKIALVLFTGSDWCPPCIHLHKEVFSQGAFTEFAQDKWILVELDFPNKKKLAEEQVKKNHKVAEKYGIEGFPTVLLLDGEGKVLGKTGFQPGGVEKYIAHLQDLLQKG